MYQLFASSKTKGGKDQTSMLRHKAANKIVDQLRSNKHSTSTWLAIHNSNVSYVRFAADRFGDQYRQGSRVPLRKTTTGLKLEQDAHSMKIPPATMKIELRADRDYSRVPRLVKFHPEFTIASGVSAPKIVTALASDGLKYKQLVSSH